jgi:hypothetical protein
MTAQPFYRIYIPSIQQHHWTADRNEYLTLRQFLGTYTPEHLVGYIFQSQVSGSVPFYRLYLASARVHHWTTDAFEYAVLSGAGWTPEGVAGYLLPNSDSQAKQQTRVNMIVSETVAADAAASAEAHTEHMMRAVQRDGARRQPSGGLRTHPALRDLRP